MTGVQTCALPISMIRGIAVGIGPGPYTGLRVGISFAVGLGRARDVPVVGVCSLDARAWQHGADEGEFAVTTNARRGEVYWASYRSGSLPQRLAGPRVLVQVPAIQTVADASIDGGFLAHRVAKFLAEGSVPGAGGMPLVAHGADGADERLDPGPLFLPQPLYVRQPDVTISDRLCVALPQQKR